MGSRCSTGVNNVIMQSCQVEPFIEIGENNIFWSSVNVCHDSNIEGHSFFAAQTLLGGFTKVGNNDFFGFKSTVIQSLTIEDETLIGVCSLINNDTNESSKYIGTPARKVGEHKQTGIQI